MKPAPRLLVSRFLGVAAATAALLAVGQFAGRSRAQSVPPAPAGPPATRPAEAAAFDAAVRDRLVGEALAPSAGADRGKFLRRMMLDVAGRPPTTEETRVFLADPSPGAERRLLDVVQAAGAENPDRARLVDWANAVAGPATAPTTGPASDAASALLLAAADEQVRRKLAQVRYEGAYVDAARQWTVVQALTAEPKVKAPYMGVGVDVPNETLRAQLKLPEGAGLVVNYVDAEGPSKDLIRKHDVLQKLDDQILINGAQLVTLVRMRKAGEAVPVTVIREARPVTVQVKLAEKDLPPLATYLSDARAAAGDAKGTAAGPPETALEVFPAATFEPDRPGYFQLRTTAPTAAPTLTRPAAPPPGPAGVNYPVVPPPTPVSPSPQSILWGPGGGDVVSAAVRTYPSDGTMARPGGVLYVRERPAGDAGAGVVLLQAPAANGAPPAAPPATQPAGGASR